MVCRVSDEVGHHLVTVAKLKESNPGVACSSKCGVARWRTVQALLGCDESFESTHGRLLGIT